MAQYVPKVSPVEARQYAGGPQAASEFMFWLGEGCCITMTDNVNGALSYKGATIDPEMWAIVIAPGKVEVLTDADFQAKYQAA